MRLLKPVNKDGGTHLTRADRDRTSDDGQAVGISGADRDNRVDRGCMAQDNLERRWMRGRVYFADVDVRERW